MNAVQLLCTVCTAAETSAVCERATDPLRSTASWATAIPTKASALDVARARACVHRCLLLERGAPGGSMQHATYDMQHATHDMQHPNSRPSHVWQMTCSELQRDGRDKAERCRHATGDTRVRHRPPADTHTHTHTHTEKCKKKDFPPTGPRRLRRIG